MNDELAEQGCPYSYLIEAGGPFLWEGRWSVALVPLNPVTAGHTLVIPRQHREFVWELDDDVLRYTMGDVAGMAHHHSQDDLDINIIQSNGVNATQTVKHVHFHVVPRRKNDGLTLPWTNQKAQVKA